MDALLLSSHFLDFLALQTPGRRDIKTEYEETLEKRRAMSQRAKDIRDKYFDHRQMGNRDQRRLREAEESEALLRAKEEVIDTRWLRESLVNPKTLICCE